MPRMSTAMESSSLSAPSFQATRIEKPLVVDADGLNALAPAGPGTFPARAVVTPHPAEMARLLGTDTASVQSDRLATARKAAREWNCVVLLKGAGTVIAHPDGTAFINPTGNPGMGSAGTGDVLSGIIAGMMGQKLPPTPQAAAAMAAGAPKIIDTKPGPPPILTKRGADILVRVEKLLDEAAKVAGKTAPGDPARPGKPVSSSAIAFPDSFAAAAPGEAAAKPAPRKN
jgi:hypothetical protein